MRKYVVSSLMSVTYRPKTRQFELDQSKITEERQFDYFIDVADFVLNGLRYPAEQSNKYECFGWVPARFFESVHERWGEVGWWRQATAQDQWLTLLVIDCDNKQGHLTWNSVIGRLLAENLSYAAYQTYSATDDHNKCRVVLDPSRWLTNAEAHRIATLLAHAWFNGDLDLSCYSVGDQFYGPPFDPQRLTDVHVAAPIDVDGWLAVCDEVAGEAPELFSTLPTPRPARPLSEAQQGIVAVLMGLRDTLREDRTINNPNFFRPEWRGEYARCSVNGSHWETMRSLLGRLWLKSGGSFTWAEMERALADIDAEDGGYFARHYPKWKADDLITFTMRTPVTQ